MSILIEVIDGEKKVSIDNRNYNEKKAKPVLQLDRQGNFIARFPSIAAAQRITGIRHIYECVGINKTRRTAGGFQWILEGDE